MHFMRLLTGIECQSYTIHTVFEKLNFATTKIDRASSGQLRFLGNRRCNDWRPFKVVVSQPFPRGGIQYGRVTGQIPACSQRSYRGGVQWAVVGGTRRGDTASTTWPRHCLVDCRHVIYSGWSCIASTAETDGRRNLLPTAESRHRSLLRLSTDSVL